MNYPELITLIASYLERDLEGNDSDLLGPIKSFIATTESKLNRELRTGKMGGRAYTPLVTDQPWYEFPEDYLACRAIKVHDLPLEYYTPQQMTKFVYSGPSGPARYYTIEANQFRIHPVASKSSQTGEESNIEITYYQRIPALSDTNPTNWVLLNHFDLYNYGALAEAERYLKNDERVNMWKNEFTQALAEVDRADKRDRWTGTPAQIRVTG